MASPPRSRSPRPSTVRAPHSRAAGKAAPEAAPRTSKSTSKSVRKTASTAAGMAGTAKPVRSAKTAAGTSTAARRRSWDAKVRPDMEPKVVADPRLGDRLLVPTPMLLAEAIAAVPAGQVLTMTALRAQLAARFGADRTCPLTAGIFAKVIAGAVADDLTRRRPPRWPIWRLVRDDGHLPDRWPLDERWRATQLRAEGVQVGHNNGWKVLGLPAGR
jgi:hypothetical protein